MFKIHRRSALSLPAVYADLLSSFQIDPCDTSKNVITHYSPQKIHLALYIKHHSCQLLKTFNLLFFKVFLFCVCLCGHA